MITIFEFNIENIENGDGWSSTWTIEQLQEINERISI